MLAIGRLSAEKRQDIVIKAVRQSRYADKIQLVFAGRGPRERKYRRLGRDLPNAPIFGFYTQEELLELINASDLYVHASEVEIEGMTLLVETGTVGGSDGKLNPTDTTTRAEMAQVLHNLLGKSRDQT